MNLTGGWRGLNFELQINFVKLKSVQNNESNESPNFPSPPVKKDILAANLPPVSPDNPPWNSWEAFGVWAASVAFIIIFPNVFLLLYLSGQNLNFTDQSAVVEFAKTDPTAVLTQISAIIPAHILTLLLAWLVVTRFKRFSFRETLGWRWNGFNVWTCLIILGGFFVLSAVVSNFFPEQNNDFLRMLKTSRTVVYVVAFLATFTAPLVEEVIYRGILYSAFQRTFKIPVRILLAEYRIFRELKNLLIKFNLYKVAEGILTAIENFQFKYAIQSAILFVTIVFALVHVPQYWGSPATIFLLCLLSLILTLIRWRTDNLLPCIALHTVFNGSQSVLLILQPYLEKYVESQQSPAAALFQFFR